MKKETKRGYRLMIQAGLSEEQFEAAMKYAQAWREDMEKNNLSWKVQTRGGWVSELRRNAFGYLITVTGNAKFRYVSSSEKVSNLVFRRISSRQRIFGIVKESEIVKTKSDPENTHENTCLCPRCTRKEKFGWASGKPPEMYMLFEFGEIRGQ